MVRHIRPKIIMHLAWYDRSQNMIDDGEEELDTTTCTRWKGKRSLGWYNSSASVCTTREVPEWHTSSMAWQWPTQAAARVTSTKSAFQVILDTHVCKWATVTVFEDAIEDVKMTVPCQPSHTQTHVPKSGP